MTTKKIKMFLLGLYLFILPIDSSLGNIIGNMSIINYVIILYLAFYILELFAGVKKKNIFKERRVRLAIVYLFMSLSSLIYNARDTGTTLSESGIYTLVIGILFYVVLSSEVMLSEDVQHIKNWIYSSGISILLGYIYTTRQGFSMQGRFALNLGRYFDPNYFAVSLNILIMLLFDKIMKKEKRVINSVYLLIVLSILLMTASRGALFTTVFSLSVYLVFQYRKKYIELLSVGLFILVIGIILIRLSNVLVPDYVLDRMSIGNIMVDGKSGRAAYWKSSLLYIQNYGNIFRYLLGFGIMSFPIVTLKYIGFEAAPHNIYVQTFFELGIIGLLILIWMIYLNVRQSKNNKDVLSLVLLMGLVVSGLTLDVILTRYFWTIMFLVNLNLNRDITNKRGKVG